jgi:hypothetical protein
MEFQTTSDGEYRVLPKTPRSQRALPLPKVVGKALAAHIAEFPPTEAGSLFTTANGNLYRHEPLGVPPSQRRFMTCGRCWIRTNLAGFWLGAILRKPLLTRQITAQRYSLLLASFQRVTACRRPGS